MRKGLLTLLVGWQCAERTSRTLDNCHLPAASSPPVPTALPRPLDLIASVSIFPSPLSSASVSLLFTLCPISQRLMLPCNSSLRRSFIVYGVHTVVAQSSLHQSAVILMTLPASDMQSRRYDRVVPSVSSLSRLTSHPTAPLASHPMQRTPAALDSGG